jgi:hypothetical protein
VGRSKVKVSQLIGRSCNTNIHTTHVLVNQRLTELISFDLPVVPSECTRETSFSGSDGTAWPPLDNRCVTM